MQAEEGPEAPEAGLTVAVTPQGQAGAERLRAYWLGKGLSRWATKPHPWTTLRRLLIEERTKSGDDPAKIAAQVDGETTNLFRAHFGYGPGADIHRVRSGKPPRGKVIGPG